jgi:N-acetyl-1-D-myo-inositol-2-amino-2-deoxy-alpha-D-glucopyranoside deacetylase
VTYDDDGFYGHPDHIQAHRVAWRAFELAADPAVTVPGGLAPWAVAKFYASTTPHSALTEEMAELRAARARDLEKAGPGSGLPRRWILPESEADLVYGVPDEQVSTEIDGSGYLDAKLAAMAAHATQITVAGRYFALSNNIAQVVSGLEHYALLPTALAPQAAPAPSAATSCPVERETDLFAGLGLDAAPGPVPARSRPVRAG